jgi:hypothetical protein
MKLESIRKLIEATPMEPWTPYKALMPKMLKIIDDAGLGDLLNEDL